MSHNNINNQDWNPVFIGKKAVPKPAVPNVKVSSTVKMNENDEVTKIKKVSKTMANAVTAARVSKKITQSELAKQTNVPQKIINDIERGDCVYNANIFNKICKVLGINIKRDV